MTAYLSKQHSCFADLDGNRDYGNCSFSSPNQHRCHQRQHHHYGSVPGGGTLPRRGGQRTWHLDQTSGSSSRLAATRAKGRSCDLWPSECGCMHSWQEPHQVKPHKFTPCSPHRAAQPVGKSENGCFLSSGARLSDVTAPHLQLELTFLATV